MWSPEKRYCWKIVLGEPVPRSERCHNWKGLQQSINICCRLSSGILIFCILFTNCLVLHNKREFQAHFVEYWEIRVFIKRPKRDSCKQKKLKLSFFPLLALPTFPSSFPDEFWILFNLCSLFAISPSLEFQWRSLSWDLLGSSILHFIGRWHPHFNTYLIEEQKLWTCLEAKNLRFVFMQGTST